jgi:hypothetical protein
MILAMLSLLRPLKRPAIGLLIDWAGRGAMVVRFNAGWEATLLCQSGQCSGATVRTNSRCSAVNLTGLGVANIKNVRRLAIEVEMAFAARCSTVTLVGLIGTYSLHLSLSRPSGFQVLSRTILKPIFLAD